MVNSRKNQRALVEQLAVDEWVEITDKRSIDKAYRKQYSNRKNVRPWHLSKNSIKKIKIRCPNCKKVREIQFRQCFYPTFLGLCRTCNSKKDLVGQKYGRLTVIKDSGIRSNGRVKWVCKCTCGNIINVNSLNLQSGHTKSCGCLQKDQTLNYHRNQGHFIKEDHTQEEIEEHIRKKYGIYKTSKWRAKRKEILERDDNTCKKCGSKEKLHIHHIYSQWYYPDYAFENEYLITLCESCHHQYHANYHAVPENFEEWLNG